MPGDTSTEAWREHAREAYEAGADEKLGDNTAAEQKILDDLKARGLTPTGRFPTRPIGEATAGHFGRSEVSGEGYTRSGTDAKWWSKINLFAEDQG